MRRLSLTGGWVLVAALTLGPGPLAADPPKPDRSALEKTLYDTLREVHNRGADLFNSGDATGCYRLFQGCLLTTRPLLSHRPDVQELIAKGLESADKQDALSKRAFALHKLIEDVRTKIKPGATPPVVIEPPVKPKFVSVAADSVGKLVGDFFEAAGKDKGVNLSRGGKYPPDHPAFVQARQYLADWLLKAAGAGAGPKPEDEARVVQALKAAGVTDAEFDAAAAVLRQVLEKNKVAEAQTAAVLKAWADRRKEIVTAAGPAPAAKGAEVTGTATFNGQPLAGADLQFVAKGTLDLRVFEATTDSAGHFLIKDIKPGTYIVIVSRSQEGKPPKPPPKALPMKYQTTTTSPLLVEAKGASNEIQLDLVP